MTNFLKKFHDRKKSAFSMIELSIVLAVVAVIISGSITVSTTALKNAKVKNTKERLAVIKEAMNLYVFKNKKLPCPARLDIISTNGSYGDATTPDGTCTNSNAGASTTADGLRYGGVPVVDLGLDTEFAGDGFDNKFAYIVPAALTQAFDTSDADPLGLEGTVISGIDMITVTETISATTLTSQAAYVILSHGPNGYGAYNINSTSHTTGSGVNDEDSNEMVASTYDSTFVIRSSDASFDDILIYDVRESILKAAFNHYDTVCDAESYDPPACGAGTIDFPATRYYDTTSIFNCTVAGCSSGTAIRTCGADGKWQPVDENCS